MIVPKFDGFERDGHKQLVSINSDILSKTYHSDAFTQILQQNITQTNISAQ